MITAQCTYSTGGNRTITNSYYNEINKIDMQYIRWPYLDEETAAFVGDFENFWPGESINPQLVLIHHQATGANPQHYIHPIQILTERENNTYHILTPQCKQHFALYKAPPLGGAPASLLKKSILSFI